jgi:nicotianamine synthase
MIDTLLFKQISTLPTLWPTPATNEAFSKLVTFCLTAKQEDITLESSDITKLQTLCSKAESEMELYWAQKIITSKDPNKELLAFWYYTNYTDLVTLEYDTFSKVKKNVRNILFVGGGSLPLTAIMLSKEYGMICTVLENDKKSYELSKQLVITLGLENCITIVNEDGGTYCNHEAFDLTYIAALVGMNELLKHEIILSVHNKIIKGSLLLCRSSYEARTLIYPPVPTMTLKHLPEALEVRPCDSIINSFIILQKT